jgi:cytochrome c2
MVIALLLAACKRETNVNGGNMERGKALINQYGCNACHTIPGVDGPHGMVGPPLDHIALRQTLAGKYPNTPEVMAKWLQDPQAMDPKNTMPNLGITPNDARDLTAFLFTLK